MWLKKQPAKENRFFGSFNQLFLNPSFMKKSQLQISPISLKSPNSLR